MSIDAGDTFELVVPGRPVSSQARRRDNIRAWRDRVRTLAKARHSGPRADPPDLVALTLIYVYEEAALDVDNVAKPIQDALIGVVLHDDSQVSDLIIRRRELGTSFDVDRLTPELAFALTSGIEFIYVRVEGAPAPGVLT